MEGLYKRGYFIRLLVSFLALTTITLLFSSVIIYKNYEKETIKENNIISEQMLSQTVYGADVIWSWASMHAIELYKNANLFHLIYGNDITQMDEFNAQTVMSYAMSSNPFIYSVYLYNVNMNKVYSTVGVSYSTRKFFDQNIITILKNKRIYSEYRFIARRIDYEHYGKKYNKEILSLIVTESLTDNKPIDGALVLNIDVSTIQNLINSFNKVKDDYFIILDQEGKVISHTQPGMFQKDLSDNKYVKEIQNNKKSSGYFSEYDGGKKYLITYVNSDKLKWSFIRFNEYNKLFEKTYGLRNIIIILTAFLFILIIGLSFWLSWRFYSPIGSLVKLVNNNMTNIGKERKTKKSNEFDVIASAYTKVVESSNFHRKQQIDNRAFLKREFLKNLMSGELQYYNDIGDKFQELEIKLELIGFMLVLFRIDDYWTDFIINNSEKDAELFKFAISNIAEEIISAKYNCAAFSMRYDCVMILLNHKNEENEFLQEILISHIAEIQKVVKEYLKISISGTIGKSASELSELPALNMGIMENSNYRLIFGKGSIIVPDMVEKNIYWEYVYQDEEEREILENLKLRNYGGVEYSANRFFENLKRFSYDDIMMSISRLSYASIKIINTISNNKDYKYNYKTLQKTFEDMDTLDEICLWMLNIYKTFVEEVSLPLDNVKCKHVGKVIEKIHKEYTNPNLSSDELASRLGLSSNYLREIFKEIKGVPLSNYINEYRCERAKEMLLHTDMTVTEISEKIGLSNQNYFFTLFKKHSGLTPTQFRTHNKEIDS